MYYHFASKREIAGAVLGEAESIYAAIAHRWHTAEVDPLAALIGLVKDLAEAFGAEDVLRAEARLTLESEFVRSRPSEAWEPAALGLVEKAIESGCIRAEFTVEKFVRVLAGSLAGQRYLAHIIASEGDSESIRARYAELLDIVFGASAADTHQRCLSDRGTLSSSDREAG